MIWIAGCCTAYFNLTGCSSLQEFHSPATMQQRIEFEGPAGLNVLCQRLLDSAINEHGLVGAQVSLCIGDKITCHVASGTTDLGRQHPMLPSNLIRVGSLTKTYTAIVALRLMEKGVLELNSPIAKWFPEYRFAERITVKMLLDHSSGIRELLGPKAMLLSTINAGRVWTTPDLLAMIFKPKLEFEPGSDHRYSNSNYILLGVLAERTTGKPLETLYRDEIFTPLDIQHTRLIPSKDVPRGLVTGFDRDLIPLPGWYVNKPDNFAWSSLAHASGGMAATGSDAMKLFEAIMRHEIISDESYRIMTTTAKAKTPRDKYLENFGLGLFKYGDVYRGTYGHMGLFVGSEAVALFDPERQFVFVLLANVSRIRDKDSLIQDFLSVIETHLSNTKRKPDRPTKCRRLRLASSPNLSTDVGRRRR